MKRILIVLAILFVGFATKAQFAVYDSHIEYEEAKKSPVQTIYGYVPTINGWVRVSLRVKETSNSILVVGYRMKDMSKYGGAFATYGNSKPWKKCSVWAEDVSVFSDGRDIASNFDYKASIDGLGTVYF